MALATEAGAEEPTTTTTEAPATTTTEAPTTTTTEAPTTTTTEAPPADELPGQRSLFEDAPTLSQGDVLVGTCLAFLALGALCGSALYR